MSIAVLDAALGYAARGWPVFPTRGKVPDGRLVAHGVLDASTDPERIACSRTTEIGIATGNGLLVLDVDPAHDGDATLRDLEDQHGEIQAPAVRTGGGGLHLYLSVEGETRNTAGPCDCSPRIVALDR